MFWSCFFSLENLAFGSPTYQSSDRYTHKGKSSAAVDGNQNPDFDNAGSCSHTSYDHEAWFAVDLGEVTRISKVAIKNRLDYCK